MGMQSVTLKPGVDVEATPSLNEAGISESQMIRFKHGLTQTAGGFELFNLTTIPSTINALFAWQDIDAVDRLAVGARFNVVVMTTGSYQDITPQTRLSSNAPNVSISSGSDVVTIVDVNAGVSELDSVWFLTPISIGNLLLKGAYPIEAAPSTGSFTIISSVVASTTIASSGILPSFTTAANSALVTVTQSNNNVADILGLQETFLVPTSVGDIIVSGPYNMRTVVDSTVYIIESPTAATSADTAAMNGGVAQYRYYITLAPSASPSGYGGGGYGDGGYGGTGTATVEPGTPIGPVDNWSMENWGEVLLIGEEDGPIYQWPPHSGFQNAQIVTSAPLASGGFFISMPQQILVTWKSIQVEGNGGFNGAGTQGNLIVRWSDVQDFMAWEVTELSAAGGFTIPTGSVIRGGLQAPNYGIIWTDVDVWIMQLTGDPTAIFNFTRGGSGCGLLSKRGAGVILDSVFWIGESNFFSLSGSGFQVLPCTVWDFIFQGMNRDYAHKVVCGPNSSFTEMAWFFPFGDATENNAYVKVGLSEPTRPWDYGFLSRTAWIDVSVLGEPIGADSDGSIYQHERGNTITGAGSSYFKTGWWAISDGQELVFVDWIIPDFIWGTYGNVDSSVQITFFSADYPGDTPRTYGPYTLTRPNQFISPRIRGRLLSMSVQSATNSVFWRLGRIRFRFAQSGRR